MAPETFTAINGASATSVQPDRGSPERHAALQALLSCPTFSIHVEDSSPGELAAARDSFPLPISGTKNVCHLGHHAEQSYGAAPYLIVRPGLGNIMVDVPRWSPQLAQRIQAVGGAKYIFLSHRDDVFGHDRWAQHLGSKRIIHALEANTRQGTDAVEWKLDGQGPWQIDEDVELIFTPGHTRGCVSLLYKPEKVLCTGDHLAFSERLDRLTIFRAYNWYNVDLQLESVAKLLHYDFLHVLPGHGRRISFSDIDTSKTAIRHLLQEEKFTCR